MRLGLSSAESEKTHGRGVKKSSSKQGFFGFRRRLVGKNGNPRNKRGQNYVRESMSALNVLQCMIKHLTVGPNGGGHTFGWEG